MNHSMVKTPGTPVETANRIAGIWTRWFLFRRLTCCAGCDAIVVSQINLDAARRIASGEMLRS